MTKILMLNVGWSNKGNRALVYSIIEMIKTFVPRVKFNLMCPIIRKKFWSCSNRGDGMWKVGLATYIELKEVKI